MAKDLEQAYYAALRSAINKVVRMVRAEASRSLRETYQISKADLDKAMSIKLSSGKNFEGELIVGGRQLRLYLFPSHQFKAGVKFAIVKGAPKILAHTFIATMQSGHTGVFERDKKKDKRPMESGRYKGQIRQPIREVMGPALADLFTNKKLMAKLRAIVKEKLPETFAHELEFFRKRWNV